MTSLRLNLLAALGLLALASALAPEPAVAAPPVDGAAVQNVYYHRPYYNRHYHRRPYYRHRHHYRPPYRHYGFDAARAHRA